MKKHKIIKIILMSIGLVFIPVYSILFGLNGNLVDMTFSQVGGRLDGKLEGLIIWGVVSSFYFYASIKYMQIMINQNNYLINIALVLGCLSLILTVFLPFNTMMYPIASQIHNKLARLAIIFLVVSIALFVISLYKYDKKLFIISSLVFLSVVIVLVIMFLKYRVSSIFQILFSTIISCYLMFDFILIEKSSKIDFEKVNDILEEEKSKLFTIEEEDE